MAVGLVLCLLAALFSIEAKLAWFGPSGSPTSQISASKLQAADAPRLIAKALARTAPAVHVPVIFAALALVVFAVPAYASFCTAGTQTLPSLLPSYFPSLFFRPPPVR